MSKVILLIVFIAVVCSASALPSVPKNTKLPSGKYCAVGSSWKTQCNDCKCSNEGMALCSRRAECTGDEPKYNDCAPDTRWKDDCNTCWCSDGVAMCTLMGCFHIPDNLRRPWDRTNDAVASGTN